MWWIQTCTTLLHLSLCSPTVARPTRSSRKTSALESSQLSEQIEINQMDELNKPPTIEKTIFGGIIAVPSIKTINNHSITIHIESVIDIYGSSHIYGSFFMVEYFHDVPIIVNLLSPRRFPILWPIGPRFGQGNCWITWSRGIHFHSAIPWADGWSLGKKKGYHGWWMDFHAMTCTNTEHRHLLLLSIRSQGALQKASPDRRTVRAVRCGSLRVTVGHRALDIVIT